MPREASEFFIFCIFLCKISFNKRSKCLLNVKGFLNTSSYTRTLSKDVKTGKMLTKIRNYTIKVKANRVTI